MAEVVARCELMENAFPAGPLKLRGEFFVVEDDSGEHMIFSTDQKGKLRLVVKGQNGNNELINLSDKFGLSENQPVTALAVSQNRDETIHLVFAARKDENSDDVFVLQPMKPQRSEWNRTFNHTVDFFTGDQMPIKVRKILLGTSNDSEGHDTTIYPQAHLVLRESNLTTEDIWALTVDASNRTWSRETEFQMPVNAKNIIDMCVANLKRYRGLFVLSSDMLGSGTTTALRFVGYDPTKSTRVLHPIIQKVPEGACRIASFDNADGYTDLVIGGKQLTWRSWFQIYKGSTSPFTVLSDEPAYADLTDLTIAQSKDTLSVWALNKASLLSYQEFGIATEDDTAPTKLTPIIPLINNSGESDRFAALQDPRLGQKLFVISKDGSMIMFEQDNQTCMWEDPVNVMISSDEIIEFKSHTIEIRITDIATNAPVARHKVKLSCSTTAELIVNGASVRGCPGGSLVTTDDTGTLTVIIKSEDLTAPLLTVQDAAQTLKSIQAGPLNIDPMSKLWSKVDTLKQPQDFRNMKLPDGSNFVQPGVQDKDLNDASGALQKLLQARKDLLADKSLSTAAATTTVSDSVTTSSSSSIGDRIWGIWYWLKNKITEGLQWVIEKVGNAWKFTVKIAGQVWEFLLETGKQIAAAVQKVLEVVCGGIKKLVQFFEFLFSWEDILDVKNVFVNLTTQGLLWGVDAIDQLESQATDFFEDLRSRVRAMKKSGLPPDMQKVKAGNDKGVRNQAENESGELGSKEDEIMQSPASRYGTYHLNHSGGTEAEDPQTGNQTAVQRLIRRLLDVWSQIEKLIERAKSNIGDLMKSKDVTLDSIFQKVGVDLLEDVIGIVQKVVVAVLGSFSDLVLELTNGLNKPIQIPVLTALYKKLTRGADFSILDAISLILAIPATFVFKIVTGKKPSEIEGVGDLIKLNAFKPELDQRMRKVRNDFKLPTTEIRSMTMSAMKMPMETTSNATSPKMNTTPPAPNAASSGKRISEKQRQAIKMNQKRFIQSSGTVSVLMKLAIPTGSVLWYNFVSWPRQLIPEEPYLPMKAFGSAALKLLLWLGSFAGVAKFTSEELKSLDFDISDRWEDPQFLSRFHIWFVGAIPVVGALGGKYVGYVFSLVSSLVQSGMLLMLHIESWTASAGYSVYLAIEEWAKAMGKLSSAISGLTQGGGGYGAGIAWFFTLTGYQMNIIRVTLEATGKREVLTTGMDLVD